MGRAVIDNRDVDLAAITEEAWQKVVEKVREPMGLYLEWQASKVNCSPRSKLLKFEADSVIENAETNDEFFNYFLRDELNLGGHSRKKAEEAFIAKLPHPQEVATLINKECL